LITIIIEVHGLSSTAAHEVRCGYHEGHNQCEDRDQDTRCAFCKRFHVFSLESEDPKYDKHRHTSSHVPAQRAGRWKAIIVIIKFISIHSFSSCLKLNASHSSLRAAGQKH